MDVINLNTNERLAAWSFSSHDTADPETEVTCVDLFSADPSSSRARVSHVVVGLDTGLHGAVAVLDVAESRIIRFIALPQRVGSLALVCGCGGPATPAFLHSSLLYYHGIVAVGLMEGKILLVDLNMDETVESRETNPAGLFFISSNSRDLARY